MFKNEAGDPDAIRRPDHPTAAEALGGIALPKRASGQRLFAGWGPKLLAFALAAGSVASLQRGASAQLEARPSCAVPDKVASIVSHPTPEIPEIALQQEVTGSVEIIVDLDADGALRSARIEHSSGNAALDAEALRVARKSRYSPTIAACTAVAESLRYTVDFAGLR